MLTVMKTSAENGGETEVVTYSRGRHAVWVNEHLNSTLQLQCLTELCTRHIISSSALASAADSPSLKLVLKPQSKTLVLRPIVQSKT